MSASLVGSEMCIRDRSRAIPPARREGDSAHDSARERPPAIRATAANRVCLLYTSDAADDM
eukprot:12796978-Alexandrium_andersonii.AAC.1